MKKLIVPAVLMILIAAIWSPIFLAPAQVKSEYRAKTSVDRSDMIENAVSNVVSELRRRDFVPVSLRVDWHPVKKTYEIYASGVDRTRLRKYEP